LESIPFIFYKPSTFNRKV